MTDYTHTLTNPGAESGDTTGWTAITGSNLTVRTASPAPHSGTYYFYSSDDTEFRYYQRVDLVTDGVPTATIDAGGIWFWVEWWQSSYSDADQGEIQIRSLNSSQVEINTQSYGLFAAPEDVWNQYVYAPILPANTRYVDIIMHGIRYSGTACDAYFDDITAKSTDTNTSGARLTQHFVEVLRSGDPNPDTRLTQHFVEVLRSSNHITYDNFVDQTPDSPPSGITKKWNALYGSLNVVDTDGVSGNKIVEENSNYLNTAWTFYSLDTYTDVQDAEVLVKIKLDKNTGDYYAWTDYANIAAVLIRANDNDANKTGYLATIAYDNDTFKFVVRLGYFNNNVWTQIGSDYVLDDNAIDIDLNSWFYVRMRVNGTEIQAKAWDFNDTEPTSWQLDQTDSTISAGGLIGWGWKTPTTQSSKHKIDFINVIIDGISSPIVPADEGDTGVYVEHLSVEVLGIDDTPGAIQVSKSSVEVLAEVPIEHAKVDSNVIVL